MNNIDRWQRREAPIAFALGIISLSLMCLALARSVSEQSPRQIFVKVDPSMGTMMYLDPILNSSESLIVGLADHNVQLSEDGLPSAEFDDLDFLNADLVLVLADGTPLDCEVKSDLRKRRGVIELSCE